MPRADPSDFPVPWPIHPASSVPSFPGTGPATSPVAGEDPAPPAKHRAATHAASAPGSYHEQSLTSDAGKRGGGSRGPRGPREGSFSFTRWLHASRGQVGGWPLRGAVGRRASVNCLRFYPEETLSFLSVVIRPRENRQPGSPGPPCTVRCH